MADLDRLTKLEADRRQRYEHLSGRQDGRATTCPTLAPALSDSRRDASIQNETVLPYSSAARVNGGKGRSEQSSVAETYQIARSRRSSAAIAAGDGAGRAAFTLAIVYAPELVAVFSGLPFR